jgi:50S ribosomal subunit-associated GTPase HflX
VEVVEGVLEEMGLHAMGNGPEGGSVEERKRVVHVFNKADLLPDPEAFLAQVRERYPHAVLTSTIPQSAIRNPQLGGVEGLRRVLRTSAQALRPVARIRVPVTDGRRLATLHRDAEVLHREESDGAVVFTVRVEARLIGKLRQEGLAVEIVR